jgi:hypothetical protein
MNALAKKEIEAQVVDRLGHVFECPEKRPREILPSGISEIDQVLGGFPRGAITEIHGAASCGRTSLMLATLAAATSSEETCALIDCSDTFDLLSATRTGMNFDHLLWVRCHQNLERAFKSTDLLLHGGGFGLVALSLSDMPTVTLRRIISTWWFRFRRAIEDTPTVLLVMTPVSCTRSCAAMALELKNETAMWPATTRFVTPGEKYVPVLDNHSAKHLSLVIAGERDTKQSTVPGHAHFLASSTIRLNRERPVEWTNQMIRFTPRLALTIFGDIR